MNTSRILKAYVIDGTYNVTEPITQGDYGYILQIEGIELPNIYRVDFANDRHCGEALSVYGDSNGVEVPEELIATGKNIYAFYFYFEEGFGKTTYTWKIPNDTRAKTGDREPTPTQQDSIDSAIAQMNTAVDKAEVAITHYPQVIDGVWYVWDEAQQTFVTTGVPATGNGIASAQLNQDYTLTLTFTDGTSFTTPVSIRGEAGATPSISATASTLPEGSSATVSVTGTTENPVINFGIPKGDSGVPTDAQVQSAVDDWFVEHPEGIVPDGSLTEAKFTSATQKKVLNNYATPEMFGAVGDGTTDDTQAIIDMFASDYDVFQFAKKTYLVDGSIDVTKTCEIYFNNTVLLAKKSYAHRDFEYIIGFKAQAIKTFGRLRVSANTSVNIGIWLAECGGSYFDDLNVANARIWGVYLDRTTNANNSLFFNKLSAVQCGRKVHAKGKYISSKSIAITDISGFDGYDIADDLFNNVYLQANKVIDDSLYTKQYLYNRAVFYATSNNPFVLNQSDKTKGTFTWNTSGATISSNYVDGENGRDIFIPIGGGIFLQSKNSEGCYTINRLTTQSNPLSFFVALGYGGTIGAYTSEYDTMVMHNESLVTSINYMYLEAVGNGYSNLFNSAYDRIIQFCQTTSGRTYVLNPFVGASRIPFMQGNCVVNYKSMNAEQSWGDETLFCPQYLAANKLMGINMFGGNVGPNYTVDELSPRVMTFDCNGYSANYTIRLSLFDLNAYRTNRFEPLVIFAHRRLTNTDYDAFKITLTSELINAGYTIHGAVDNVLTIQPSQYNNNVKVTIVLFRYSSTFYVTAEALTFVDNTV